MNAWHFKLEFRRFLSWLAIFLIGLFLAAGLNVLSLAQSPNALSQQATSAWQQGRTIEALSLWKQLATEAESPDERARGYLMLAQGYLELGDVREGGEALARAKLLDVPELLPFVAGIEGNLALLSHDFDRAITAYQQAPQSLATLNNLSLAYQRRSQLRAQQALEATWEGDASQQRWEAQSRKDSQQSQGVAKRALALAGQEVSLDAARSWIRWGQLGNREAWGRASAILKPLPDSVVKGQLLLEIARQDNSVLSVAQSVAQTLNSPSLMAQVFRLHSEEQERWGNYPQALDWSRRAYGWVAQSNLALRYELEGDLGRLYHQLKQPQPSRTFYRKAIASAERVRRGIASGTRATQLAFQSSVNPLYRSYLGVLLAQPTQEDLLEAISVLKQFQLAELESYFADPCELTLIKDVSVDPTQATLYTITLPDALHEIIRVPGQPYRHRAIAIAQSDLASLVRQWRNQLEDEFSDEFRASAAQLYDWLIRPWLADLQGLKTLVFVNDGALRSVPMAALWDGEHYLIESWAVVYSPVGFEEGQADSKAIAPALFAASQGSAAFPEPIPYVEAEVEAILAAVGGTAYLNEDFTSTQLTQALDSPDYTVLHLASHARFASFEESFVQSGEGILSLAVLEQNLRSKSAPLQLLVLSGCQTATGNDRAILGLAGIGLRSGIPSVLGSLWFASDKTSAKFMLNFYRAWATGLPVAASLRQSQLELLRSPLSHPRYWSTYLNLVS